MYWNSKEPYISGNSSSVFLKTCNIKVAVITQKNLFTQYKPCVWKRELSLLLWNTAMLRLDPAARNVIGLHWSGQYQTQVVRQLNVHLSTISRLWRRLNQTGSALERSIRGRPHTTIPAQDQYIRVFHLGNRCSHWYSHCCWYAMITGSLRRCFSRTRRDLIQQR